MLGFNVVKVNVVHGNTTNGCAGMDFDLNEADVATGTLLVALVTLLRASCRPPTKVPSTSRDIYT